MSVVCLTGWQQRVDALREIAPDALHVDYRACASVEAAFALLPPAPRLAIGWSLGGQMLLRAVAAGRMRPQRLILLATPVQFVADEVLPEAMDPGVFATFSTRYDATPERMMKAFQSLMIKGDDAGGKRMEQDPPLWPHGRFWLDELGRFSGLGLRMDGFPPTLIVHGKADGIVPFAQSERLALMLPGARLELWEGCAHAPHWHDAVALRQKVAAYA